MRRRFQQVDVFAPRAFTGNPLAVVLDGEGLSTEDMLQVTRWLNLSETTFLLPPTTAAADYRVRIFTLARELPFAGHPTLGSCHAWLTAGGTPKQADRVVQECAAGLIGVKRDADRLAFAAPPLIRSGPLDEPLILHLASVLRIRRDQIVDAHWVDNGPGWVGILFADAATVLAIDPDFSRHPGPGSLDIGLVGPTPRGAECAFEVRAVFSDEQGGMREDPVTGSLNASLAQWLLASGRATAPYIASQGTRLGRAGRVHVDRDPDGTVWVGGKSTTCVRGEIEI